MGNKGTQLKRKKIEGPKCDLENSEHIEKTYYCGKSPCLKRICDNCYGDAGIARPACLDCTALYRARVREEMMKRPKKVVKKVAPPKKIDKLPFSIDMLDSKTMDEFYSRLKQAAETVDPIGYAELIKSVDDSMHPQAQVFAIV